MASVEQMTATCDALATRLNTGWERIKTLEARGEDVTKLESFWLALLVSYEEHCDLLAAAEAEAVLPARVALTQSRMPISSGVR